MANAQLDPVLRHLRTLRDAHGLAEASDAELLKRFTVWQDEAAFTALLRRHGPMVLGVSQRVLHIMQDAEDVFQATFLLLARKAGSIQKRAAVASWLHGVAHRLALRAKEQRTRRKDHELRMTDMRNAKPKTESPWRDMQAALDAALGELPDKYRAALVLCYLEGKSHAEAAAELGCPLTTLRTHVARGRKLLREHLTRRGLTLSTAGIAALLLATAAPAAPPPLAKATVTAVLAFAAGHKTAAVCSASVAGLVNGGVRIMVFGKLKIVLVLLAVIGVAFAAYGLAPLLAFHQDAKPTVLSVEPRAVEVRGGPQAANHTKVETVEVTGRVLDPDGKAVSGAKLVFAADPTEKAPEKVWARSAADGRFRFLVPKAIAERARVQQGLGGPHVVAGMNGFGFALAPVPPGAPAELTLRLVKDDVPIEGRILDLQGQPVADVKVRIEGVMMPKEGDLAPFVRALQISRQAVDALDPTWTGIGPAPVATLFRPITTGKDGRFQLNGIGRERMVMFRVEGPTIAARLVIAMTRAGKSIQQPEDNQFSRPKPPTIYNPAAFDYPAAPTRPIVGVVRDRDTGKPLAGVPVYSYRVADTDEYLEKFVQTTTDQEGRFRLVGLTKVQGHQIMASADNLPYFSEQQMVPDSPGLEPVKVDFTLRRGVWIKGKVLDKSTGKGISARVEYFCFLDNPFLKVQERLPRNERTSEDDGSFRLVALPGPGIIAVHYSHTGYRLGAGAEEIGRKRENGVYRTQPYPLSPGAVHTVVAVSPAPDAESGECKVVLDPGLSVPGTVVGPGSKPLTGARINGLSPMSAWEYEPRKSADFTVRGLGPNESRLVQVIHDEKKLAATQTVRGDEKGPVRIQLQPWGVVVGRLVLPEGLSPTDVQLIVWEAPRPDVPSSMTGRPVRPDKQGKFRIEGLIPGAKYNLSVGHKVTPIQIADDRGQNVTTKTGETKDLGEVPIKPQ